LSGSVSRRGRRQDFEKADDGDDRGFLEGNNELVDDCRSLARFELRGFPPMTAGAARIRVTFQVDADGLLSVKAEETTSSIAADVVARRRNPPWKDDAPPAR